MRPRNADIFVAMVDGREEVALQQTKRLLLAGEASVLDVDPRGDSILSVGEVLLLQSSRTLICSVDRH